MWCHLALVTTTFWRQYVPPKRPFFHEPHGVTSQKTAFFIVTAVKTSNLPTEIVLNPTPVNLHFQTAMYEMLLQFFLGFLDRYAFYPFAES
jgi:hypothetical protein